MRRLTLALITFAGLVSACGTNGSSTSAVKADEDTATAATLEKAPKAPTLACQGKATGSIDVAFIATFDGDTAKLAKQILPRPAETVATFSNPVYKKPAFPDMPSQYIYQNDDGNGWGLTLDVGGFVATGLERAVVTGPNGEGAVLRCRDRLDDGIGE